MKKGVNNCSDLISESSSILQFANADYQRDPDLIELMNVIFRRNLRKKNPMADDFDIAEKIDDFY